MKMLMAGPGTEDRQRAAFVKEIERLVEARSRTKSARQRRDYKIAIVRMGRELDYYDRAHEKRRMEKKDN